MKFLTAFILVTFSLSTSIFAQDNYHVDEENQSCDRQACLIIGGLEIGFYEFTDIDGYKFLRLNNESSAMDMNLSRGCFTGEVKEVVNIIEAIVGVTNRDYASGGHVNVIKTEFAEVSKDQINVRYTYEHDYMEGTLVLSDFVKRCK